MAKIGPWKMEFLSALIVLLAAHALTYFLVNVLPDATVIALGFESAKKEVLSSLQSDMARRPYLDAVLGIIRLDLGHTLDRVSVRDTLSQSLLWSMPRILGAMVIVLAGAAIASFGKKYPRILISFLSFLPPYVSAFFTLIVLLAIGAASPAGAVTGIACTISVSLAPAMLAMEQAIGIMQRNLSTDYARTLRAIGANEYFLHIRLIPNLIAEIMPSVEKIFVLIIAGLLFAEPILGLPGIGTTTVRAVRRADPDLLLGLVLFFTLSVVLARLTSVYVRRRFGLAA